MPSLKKLNAEAGTAFRRWKEVAKALRGNRDLKSRDYSICDVDPCDGPCPCKSLKQEDDMTVKIRAFNTRGHTDWRVLICQV